MELLVPALVAGAAIGFTYFFCIRPMREGHCGMGGRSQSGASADAEELQLLRDEVAALRRETPDPLARDARLPGTSP